MSTELRRVLITGAAGRIGSDFRQLYGDRYAGHVKEGKPDGSGVFTWASGARHEGEWRQGTRYRPGVAVTADGTETAGQWAGERATAA